MKRSKTVIKKDLNGVELKRFVSCAEAAIDIVENDEKVKNIQDKINKCCLGKIKKVKNFIYEYAKTEPIKELPYKCPYCERSFNSYNGLCKHVIKEKMHDEISKEKLLTDFKYNGVRPTCKCGCGNYTNISYEGGAHFSDYLLGHGSRINNNWGHNDKAQEKSAETRRKQYKEGSRVQWNKNKKWNETYTQEQIVHLIEQYKNKGSISSNLEEYFMQEYLIKNNVKFQRQFYIKEIRQFCDFYIKELNVIIETDGGFWHCDSRLYPNGPKYDMQRKRIEKDKIKDNFLKDNGYNLIRLWEIDIYKNPEMIKKVLKDNKIIK